eukprot:PhM_4_TR4229/c0_g1_i1/m.5884
MTKQHRGTIINVVGHQAPTTKQQQAVMSNGGPDEIKHQSHEEEPLFRTASIEYLADVLWGLLKSIDRTYGLGRTADPGVQQVLESEISILLEVARARRALEEYRGGGGRPATPQRRNMPSPSTRRHRIGTGAYTSWSRAPMGGSPTTTGRSLSSTRKRQGRTVVMTTPQQQQQRVANNDFEQYEQQQVIEETPVVVSNHSTTTPQQQQEQERPQQQQHEVTSSPAVPSTAQHSAAMSPQQRHRSQTSPPSYVSSRRQQTPLRDLREAIIPPHSPPRIPAPTRPPDSLQVQPTEQRREEYPIINIKSSFDRCCECRVRRVDVRCLDCDGLGYCAECFPTVHRRDVRLHGHDNIILVDGDTQPPPRHTDPNEFAIDPSNVGSSSPSKADGRRATPTQQQQPTEPPKSTTPSSHSTLFDVDNILLSSNFDI